MPMCTPAIICFSVILLFPANAIALQGASTVGSEAVEVGNHLQKYVRILTAMTWSTNMYIYLVGGFNPFEKYARQIGSFLNFSYFGPWDIMISPVSNASSPLKP